MSKLDPNDKVEMDKNAMDAVLFMTRYQQSHGEITLQQMKDLYPFDGGVPNAKQFAINALEAAWVKYYAELKHPKPLSGQMLRAFKY